MPQGFPYHRPSRQAALPPPQMTAGIGNHGFLAPVSGRVVKVNDDDTVDVLLENGNYLPHVPVGTTQSGPDRTKDDLPRKRSVVVIQFLWGSKDAPFVSHVLPRDADTHKPKGRKAKGCYRRVFPNGTHLLVQDSGAIELQAADGTYLTIGGSGAPLEDYTGQERESSDGNPLADPPNDASPKPSPFQLTLQMADGSKLVMKDGAVTLSGAGSLTIESGADFSIKSHARLTITSTADTTVHASGPLGVKSDAILSVDAPILRLNGGTKPVARLGDPVSFAGPIAGGNLTVLA